MLRYWRSMAIFSVFMAILGFFTSFWFLRSFLTGSESLTEYFLIDIDHIIFLVGIPLLAAIFCALMDIGDRLRERGQG